MALLDDLGSPAPAPAPVPLRALDDYAAARQAIFDNVLTAVGKKYPLSNQRYSLGVENLKYDSDAPVSIADQKRAILAGQSVERRLVGDWVLKDLAGKEMDRKKNTTVAHVPYMTNRGTFIHNGSEYSVCLHPDTLIWTEVGQIKIRDIVNKDLSVNVWSYDFSTKEFVLKPIVKKFRHKILGGIGHIEFNSAGTAYKNGDKVHPPTTLWGTPTHSVYTKDGLKHELRFADKVALAAEKLSYTQKQVLYGGLLGDSHIDSRGTLRLSHGLPQEEYFFFKKRIFGTLGETSDRIYDNSKSYINRNKETIVSRSACIKTAFKSNIEFCEARWLCYPNGKKTVTMEWLNRVDEMGLAIWFMDDGCVFRQYPANTAGVTLCTQGFTDVECDLIISWFMKRWSLKCYKSRSQSLFAGRNIGWTVQFCAEEAEKFFDLVAPYIHPSLFYKLLKRPNTWSCLGCGCEVKPGTKWCVNCVVKNTALYEKRFSNERQGRALFGSIVNVKRVYHSGEVFKISTGCERWERRMQAAGIKVQQMLLDNKQDLSIVDVPCVYKEKTGKQWEKTATVYNLEVADTHNYFANSVLTSNCSQMRLRPGIYSRRRESGELESHFNIKPGTGRSFRVYMEPNTGVFRLGVGQSTLKLYPLLRAMGIQDRDLATHWGKEILQSNIKADDPRAVSRAFAQFLDTRTAKEDADTTKTATGDNQGLQLRQVFETSELDPDVTTSTLGKAYSNAGPEAILGTTKRLLDLSKGLGDTDDRDSLEYQTFHTPEDFFGERIVKDAGQAGRRLLWKATLHGNLSKVPPAALSRQVRSVILNAGVAQALEESNLLEPYDQAHRVIRLGEGGISSVDAIPDESRNVNPSQFGLIDAIKTPESSRAGIDTRFTHGVFKGPNNTAMFGVLNARTGAPEFLTAQQAAKANIAFPGEFDGDAKKVRVMSKSRGIDYVNRDKVDYVLPSALNMFTASSNVTPMIGGIKGGRLSMGSRFANQALPLKDAEAPLVRSDAQDLGGRVGAVKAGIAGVVSSITKDGIEVRGIDGKTTKHELYHNFPLNRKTFIHNEPQVAVGDKVLPDTVLAKSNFTDKNGDMALGKNLRVAYIPWKGLSYEDAIVISETAAKKLSSEHMYQNVFEPETNDRADRRAFLSVFPAKFNDAQLRTLDSAGVVKPGTTIKYGDPLLLAVRKASHDAVHRGREALFTDASMTWKHDADGLVTDVAPTRDGGWNVTVKSYAPMQEADKLCYDSDTDVLTSEGWKKVSDVSLSDEIASRTADGRLEYIKPVGLHKYWHDGKMYNVSSTQVDLSVTPNHNLFARRRYDKDYSLIEAIKLLGKEYRMVNNADWEGADIREIVIPGVTVKAGQGGVGSRFIPDLRLSVSAYMILLGTFLSEGSVVWNERSGSFGIQIAQIKPDSRAKFIEIMSTLGLKFSVQKEYFVVYDKRLAVYFKQFGHSHQKFIPNNVFGFSKESLRTLYDWLMWGDGHTGKTHSCYYTSSRQLADDFQRLCLHVGYAGKLTTRPAYIRDWDKTYGGKGRRVGRSLCRENYVVYVYRKKNNPTINHEHVKKQKAQHEGLVDFSGNVFCITLPRNHVLYVRRNGKPIWSGNSGRFGDKGVISKVLPDSQMPHDANGEPFEVILNPLGVISRGNPSQVFETLLSKVARKTGEPYRLPHFSKTALTDFVKAELQKHDVRDTEDLVNPDNGAKIPKVMTGERYFYKLHHTVEAKGKSRDVGSYTIDDIPASGGSTGSKRIAGMETAALLSHGVPAVIRDAKVVRGQRNDEYWRYFRQGITPPSPKVPMIYKKFMASLQSAGVNVQKKGDKLHLFGMTGAQMDALAPNEITAPETVKGDNMEPIAGGLFDPKLTGGHGGDKWSYVRLAEPLPNPIMEDPIRRLLGLTKKKFEAVLSGAEDLHGKSGGAGIRDLLNSVSVPDRIRMLEDTIRNGAKSKRDDAVKALGFLKSMQQEGVTPADFITDKVPVLPPAFRPIVKLDKMMLNADPNFLYKDLMHVNSVLGRLGERLPGAGSAEERLRVYHAYKAVTGLGDPVNAKTQEKNVKGILGHIFGSGGPKTGTFQRRVIGMPVDVVGRSVVTPNPDLSMDQVGIPEDLAWTVYRPFAVRRMIRSGMPATEAARAVADKKDVARRAMLEEMSQRPVMVNRAPTLHKFNFMAFKPIMIAGKTIQVSPVITKGFGMDFDGNCILGSSKITLDISKDADILRETCAGDPAHNLTEAVAMKFGQESRVKVSTGECVSVEICIKDMPYLPETEVLDKNGAKVYSVPDGLSVRSVDVINGLVTSESVTGFTIEENVAVSKVKTRRGYEVTASDNESLCVYDHQIGGLVKVKPADAVGRLAPIASKQPIFGNEGDYEFGWMIGAFVSDGFFCGDQSTIGYAKTCERHRTRFAEALQRYEGRGVKYSTFRGAPKAGVNKIGTSAKDHFYAALKTERLLRQCYVEKKVPEDRSALYKTLPPLHYYNEDTLWGILAGLLDGDGSVSINHRKGHKEQILISFNTSSVTLRDSVVDLCRSLGIRANWSSYGPKEGRLQTHEAYIIPLSLPDVKPAVGCLKLCDDYKMDVLHKLAEQETVRDDRNIVPIPDRLMNLSTTRKGPCACDPRLISTLNDNKTRRKPYYYVTRESAKRLLAHLKAAEVPCSDWEVIVNAENIHWDPIESVEPAGTDTVYDIMVPSTKVFAVNGGLVVYDTVNFHVPVSDDAAQEANTKMLPSRNLFSARTFKTHYLPSQEFLMGLYLAAKKQDKPPRLFATREDALRAYSKGELRVDEPIQIGR